MTSTNTPLNVAMVDQEPGGPLRIDEAGLIGGDYAISSTGVVVLTTGLASLSVRVAGFRPAFDPS
jgi:hypothetical protein